jgi:hypothetical protein
MKALGTIVVWLLILAMLLLLTFVFDRVSVELRMAWWVSIAVLAFVTGIVYIKQLVSTKSKSKHTLFVSILRKLPAVGLAFSFAITFLAGHSAMLTAQGNAVSDTYTWILVSLCGILVITSAIKFAQVHRLVGLLGYSRIRRTNPTHRPDLSAPDELDDPDRTDLSDYDDV